MAWLKWAFKQFVAQAHALGAIYYTWAILAAVITGAYTLYKRLTLDLHGGSELAFWTFVAGVSLSLLLAPVLITVLVRKASRTSEVVANPTLCIQKRVVAYQVGRESLLKEQVVSLQALDFTRVFRFHVALTGIGSAAVVLKSAGAKLLGPVPRGSGDSYEILFDTPLEPGGTTTVAFDISVSDPGRTMRPFLSDKFTNAAKYGAFRATYLFDELPTKVMRDRSTAAGETIESGDLLQHKAPNGAFQYAFEVAKVDPHCVYTVSWVW